MAVGFPAKTNFATGDVLTATNVNDITGTLNLLESAQYAAGKNKIINGAMNVWQRGTSINAVSGTYTADRYLTLFGGTGTFTVSQQAFTPGAAPVAGYESSFFLRQVVNTVGTSTAFQLQNRIEDVRTLAGQTVTFSFWAKGNVASSVNIYLDQQFGSGGSTNVTSSDQTIAITTSWARYSYTVALGSLTGKTIGTSSFLSVIMRNLNLGTLTTLDTWGWQLEAASTASPFQTASGSIGGELALCQRYYVRFNASTSGPYAVFAPSGITSSTTQSINYTNLPVELRTYPSSIEYGGTMVVMTTSTSQTVTSIALQDRSSNKIVSITYTVASGLTANQFSNVRAENSATAYLGISAELQEITMDKVTFIEVEGVEHAIIDRGNGEYTSMLKSTYDELSALEAAPE